MTKPQTFIFMGRSGCGKGTQAKLLVDYLTKHPEFGQLPVKRIETGARLRAFVVGDSYVAKRVAKVLDEGGLMPPFMAIHTWAQAFDEELTESGEHLIMDGVARIKIEAELLDDAFKFFNRERVNIIFFDLSEETARQRLLARGRGDDNEADIKRRLQWFEEQVRPSVEYYRNNPDYNFIVVNGEGTVEEIHQELIQKLYGGN